MHTHYNTLQMTPDGQQTDCDKLSWCNICALLSYLHCCMVYTLVSPKNVTTLSRYNRIDFVNFWRKCYPESRRSECTFFPRHL